MKSCICLKRKKRKLGYMAVKLDMEKACDRIESDFIKVILSKLGFYSKWIEWVMEYISIMSYFILINGILKEKI